MTTQIFIKGWRPGLQKISLAKLFRSYIPISLSESKKYVDLLLDGEQFSITIADRDTAQQFVEEATALGAICEPPQT